MNYNSTRNAALQVTAAQAIAQGISEEGGLFEIGRASCRERV